MAFDYSIFLSLAFLFGIAAQFRAADGSSFLRALISRLEGRLGLMYSVVVVTSAFSPFILNDVLVLILTPVLIGYSKESGEDIAPLVVAEITFTNIASALTPLGNPQNILLWQASGVSAGAFVAGTAVRVALSGAIAALLLLRFRGAAGVKTAREGTASWAPAAFLLGAAVIVFASNVFGVPSVVALGFAFGLGFAFTFRSVARVVREFDVRSLLTLYALVGVTAVVAYAFQPLLVPFVRVAAAGSEPYTAGFFGLVSAVISNVPATQLILSVSSVSPHAAPSLGVDAGLAGNIGPISSFANILALLMLSRSGISVRKTVVLQLVVGLVSFVPAAF